MSKKIYIGTALFITFAGILYYYMKKSVNRKVIQRFEDIPETVFSIIENFETSGIAYGKNANGLYYEYPDAAGFMTIGIGHLNTTDKLNGLTYAQVKELFKKDLKTSYIKVKAVLKPEVWNELSGMQIGMLMSFVFNTGNAGSTLLQLINAKKYTQAVAWWRTHYVTSNGVFLQGLQNRRNKEADVFANDLP